MKTMNNREFKKFFKATYPSFSNAKIKNFKKVVTYPNSGSIRFQINLDKNGQVYDIHQSFVSIIRDVETKKRYVKVTLGDRPRLLLKEFMEDHSSLLLHGLTILSKRCNLKSNI